VAFPWPGKVTHVRPVSLDGSIGVSSCGELHSNLNAVCFSRTSNRRLVRKAIFGHHTLARDIHDFFLELAPTPLLACPGSFLLLLPSSPLTLSPIYNEGPFFLPCLINLPSVMAIPFVSLGNSSKPKSFPAGPSIISTTNFSRKSSRPLLPSAQPQKQLLSPSASVRVIPPRPFPSLGPTLRLTLPAG
jgi:hypothetical protein